MIFKCFKINKLGNLALPFWGFLVRTPHLSILLSIYAFKNKRMVSLLEVVILISFNLPTRGVNLPTCAFNLATRDFSLLTHGFELVTRGFKLITREFELVTRSLYFIFPRGKREYACSPQVSRQMPRVDLEWTGKGL